MSKDDKITYTTTSSTETKTGKHERPRSKRSEIGEPSITIIMIVIVHSHFSFNTLVPSLTSLNVSPVAHCVNLGVRNKRCRDGKQCPYCTSIKTGTLSPPLVHVLQKRSGRRKPGSQGLHPSYKLDTTLPPTAYLLKKKI